MILPALLLLAALAVPSPAPAPPAATAPVLPAEGERVAAVRVEGPAELARYVEIAPGDAYQAAAVRHAVELLHAAGDFEDVRVLAERQAEGWLLAFRLRPAPRLLGAVVEGDRVLDAGEALSRSGLRRGAVVDAAALSRAAHELALFLGGRGYLEAHVEPELRRQSGGALAVFQLRAGPVARLRRVQLSAPAEVAAVFTRALPRPGRRFSREEARKLAREIRDALRSRGRWEATAEVLESYDPTVGAVDLDFQVEPGPFLSVAVRGTTLPRSLRNRITARLREGGAGADVRDEVVELVETDLLARGHRAPRVTPSEEAAGLRKVLVYSVAPGPRAVVERVQVKGDPGLGLGALLSTRAGRPLLDRQLEDDQRALKRALEHDGYAEAVVEVEVPEGGGELPVEFRLRPGPHLVTGTVKVRSPVSLGPGEVRELHLRSGAPYRVSDVAQDRNALLLSFRNAGYPEVAVEPEVTREGEVVSVELVVEPGPQVILDHLVVNGLRRTQEEVVRRALALREGEPLGLQRVLESQRRLTALGLFQRVRIDEIDPDRTGRRSLVVVAEEAQPFTVAYGVGYGERDLLRGSIEATRRNLFGMDRSLTLFGRLSFRGNRALATYREPWLFGRAQELFVTAFREEEARESFSYVRAGGLVQTAHPLGGRWNLIARYGFQDTHTFEVDIPCGEQERQFCNSRVSGPSASAVQDTRDDPLDPRRGRFLGADLQFSHRIFGGHSFLKGFLQGTHYTRLDARNTLALSARLGLARTLGRDEPLLLPLPELFFAGGDNGPRGFATDSVRARGGNALVLGGAELRAGLGKRVALAAFADAGNVFALVSDLDFTDLRYSAGLGLRYRSAVGPLRVDYGYKLDRRPGESPGHLHVTIGHAF